MKNGLNFAGQGDLTSNSSHPDHVDLRSTTEVPRHLKEDEDLKSSSMTVGRGRRLRLAAGVFGEDDSSSAAASPAVTPTRRHRRPRVEVIGNKGRHARNSADFAREAVISAFGWNHGKALDQADFRDRPPGQFPAPIWTY